MKQRVMILAVVLMLVMTMFQFAGDKDTLKYSLQIRHRFEMNGKDFNSDTDASNYNLLRTRFSLTFKPLKNMEAFVQFQDARVFGEETSTLGDGSADRFDLHQGYFKVKEFLGMPLTLKLGRMEVVYGPQRLIGAVGWHNIGRSFDGVIFTFNFSKVSIDIFNLKEIENLEVGDIGDKNVMGINADFKLSSKYTAQAFFIWQKMNPSDFLSRYTTGIYVKGKLGAFRHELELAYQGGKLGGMDPLPGLDVSAFLAAFNFGYTLSDSGLSPDIALGVDYLSGDDNFGDNKYEVFDTLYATNHKYYGFMDYFLNIPVHTQGLGLMDVHAAVSVKPSAQMSASLKYHNFRANVEHMATGSKSFGSELDLTVKYTYNKHLSFVLGASAFMPGEIFKMTRGEDTATWLYLMTIFKL